MTDLNEAPINPLPPVVWALVVPMAMAELMFNMGARGLIGGAGAVGWRIAAIQDFAFSAEALRWMVETGRYPVELLWRFVTYPFVHAHLSQAVFAIVFILALGKMVGEIFRAWAVLAVFFGSSIFGAIMYTVLVPNPIPLIGAFPGAYGLIGAYSFLLWVTLGARGLNQASAFTLIGFLMGLQLLFGALFGGSPDWVAELFGFVAGFALSFVVSPGGWSRLMAKMRRD
ncbi:MAG: rhomboid family intramembrane serine protease [Rhodovulum sp.]|jgi:membrane associated rhomboid family serine protease|nr:rhomboid family intramembrane serine protease [Rhodovulum sp.]MCI5087369.1 rhomboid family intramembrane serine protease [Rhodovulum sp.]|tara:strand:- start:837 stop:1520 length:684 start_codon:yes stop_codon:yes gene_type:complete